VAGIMRAYSYVLGYDVKSETPAKIEIQQPVIPSPKVKVVTSKVAPADIQRDDLKKIKGIGPKIESLLNAGGIYSFADLANAKMSKLKTILTEAGSRYKMHNPSTWKEQAEEKSDS